MKLKQNCPELQGGICEERTWRRDLQSLSGLRNQLVALELIQTSTSGTHLVCSPSLEYDREGGYHLTAWQSTYTIPFLLPSVRGYMR